MKNSIRLCFTLAVVASLFLGGCVSYISPKLGSVAQEDAVIKIDTLDEKRQEWKKDEVSLSFSTIKAGNDIELTGDLIFSSGLTNTFNKVRRFYIKMSFVDDQRQVLSVVDITPLLASYRSVPEKSKFHVQTQVPQGGEAIVFNYYGVFFGDEGRLGENEVYYSPFN